MPQFGDPQINIYARDVEAMTRFYTETLGFTETFRVPTHGAPEHVEVRLGGLLLGFASVAAAQAYHGFDADRAETRAEVVLWVANCDEAYAYLLARGATPVSEPHDFIGTLRGAWVADPEGNPVHMVARL
jgi:catechol 2,3-dioxygenase-like lactoylglutathione lyase family enzyme